MSGRRFAALFLLLAAAGAAGSAQERLLLVVRSQPGAERYVAELAEACAYAFDREGFVTLSLPDREAGDPFAASGRLGAAFVVEVEVSGGEDVVVEAILSAAADRARLAAVAVVGPASLGMQRKAAHIAAEIGPQARRRLAADALAAARAAADAASAAAPAPPPAPAAEQPAPAVAIGAAPAPPPQPEQARLAAARRARLQHDLARARERRRRGTVRAAVAWGAATLAVAGAIVAWRMSDEGYEDYADESEDESGLRQRAVLLSWAALAAGGLAGASAVTGLVFWLRRPDPAPIERQLAELDDGGEVARE